MPFYTYLRDRIAREKEKCELEVDRWDSLVVEQLRQERVRQQALGDRLSTPVIEETTWDTPGESTT